jgi:hypothetical protein
MATYQVTKYNYQFHGGVNGYSSNRAVLRLKNENTAVAYVHFVPEGKAIPNDTESSSGFIRMYMPESAIYSVIDMLRNESPISIYYAAGSGFLRTGNEPVGEGEEEL